MTVRPRGPRLKPARPAAEATSMPIELLRRRLRAPAEPQAGAPAAPGGPHAGAPAAPGVRGASLTALARLAATFTALGVLVLAGPAQASLPDRAVRIARAELARGVHEVPDGSNESPRIALYRNAVRWSSGPAAWCGYFVSWVAREAGAPIGAGGHGFGLVREIRRWGIRTGRWRSAPSRGSIVVFRHSHVGIVERVAGASVVTLEGNHDNRVARVRRGRGEIRGYVRLSPPSARERADEPWAPEPFRWPPPTDAHRTSGR